MTPEGSAEGDFIVTIQSRAYLSSRYLALAALAAERCGQIEDEIVATNGTANSPEALEHECQAISAVISAVAYLEALVNEVFQDASDFDAGTLQDNRVSSIPEAAVHRMAGFWVTGDKIASILPKYEQALRFSGLPSFSRGEHPLQAAQLLISLRNDLMHARPAWRQHGEPPEARYEDLARRFPHNRIHGADSPVPFYPSRCLGAGCANWAVDTATSFSQAWCERMGLLNTFTTTLDSAGVLPVAPDLRRSLFAGRGGEAEREES